jgi:predicted transcriptional regulator
MNTLTKTERRTRILSALEDGEFLPADIAAWAELSFQAVRADLAWLRAKSFATDDGRWAITDTGRSYLAGLADEEKDW